MNIVVLALAGSGGGTNIFGDASILRTRAQEGLEIEGWLSCRDLKTLPDPSFG